MMSMQIYLSHLLDESSADSFVVVRDDARVENSRRRKFKWTKKQPDTCQWKPLSKSKAPTLPARSISTEDLFASKKKDAHEDGQANAVFSNPSTGEGNLCVGEEGCSEEGLDLSPFNTILSDLGSSLSEEDSLVCSPPSPLRKRTSSLDSALLPKSTMELPAPSESSSLLSDKGQSLGHRSSDCLSLSHTQRLNLYGLIDDVERAKYKKKKNRCPPTEAPPIQPCRKTSNDDLSRPSMGHREHIVEALDNVILNSTWEPLQDKQQQTLNSQKKDILLTVTDNHSIDETRA